jgi:hypothetical protein
MQCGLCDLFLCERWSCGGLFCGVVSSTFQCHWNLQHSLWFPVFFQQSQVGFVIFLFVTAIFSCLLCGSFTFPWYWTSIRSQVLKSLLNVMTIDLSDLPKVTCILDSKLHRGGQKGWDVLIGNSSLITILGILIMIFSMFLSWKWQLIQGLMGVRHVTVIHLFHFLLWLGSYNFTQIFLCELIILK